MFPDAIKLILALFLVAVIVATAGVWLLPVTVAQSWAFERSSHDPYAQFEAVGQMEALWWLGRMALPSLGILLIFCMWRLESVERVVKTMTREILTLTEFKPASNRRTPWLTCCRSWGVRLFLLAWMVIGVSHAVGAVLQRTRDWPYYHWNSGAVVLPNISDSNRDVIRYLRQTTPENSRLFIFSDQKLFFLSYYLLPRRLFHRVHAGSEFVIPLPNQERQLEAYVPSDLSLEEVNRSHPDYILEYFEGHKYNDVTRRGDDDNWVRFWQSLHQRTDLPPYVVVLRQTSAKGIR